MRTDPWQASLRTAEAALGAADAVLARLIIVHGPCTIQPHTDYYYELVSSIISQQLSVKAAATIQKRFMAIFGGQLPTPEQILAHEVSEYRAAGLSNAKSVYVQDLAQHVLDGRLDLTALPQLTNEAIVRELTAVKGIGEWTAHMFLMFSLGRLDVLPVGDLGFRNGLRLQYGFDHAPTPAECRQLAEANGWAPYESIATWYMWQSLDNQPKL